MTVSVRLWLAAAHHPAFRSGGWAYVRAGSEVVGEAGGERQTERGAMVLAALEAVLAGAPQGPVMVQAGDVDAAAIAALAAEPALHKALSGRELRLVRLGETAGTPLAFAQAWADLAADRAKARGPFRAAIPKPNLAKVAGL
jgi:hypothetical protein